MSRVKRGVTAHARHKKKLLRQPKVTTAVVRTPFALLSRRSKKRHSTLTATVKLASATSVLSGSSVSTQRPVNTA